MGKPAKSLIAHVSAALRDESLDHLEAAFARYVEVLSSRDPDDSRDVMINLVPYIDCARRLGRDPESVLGLIADSGAAWFREILDPFLRRTDIALGVFGWKLIETPDGISYKWIP
ncbi:MAG TPA: hypothetical protein VF375_05725 [Candidatus Limnocylindrales bacterium]